MRVLNSEIDQNLKEILKKKKIFKTIIKKKTDPVLVIYIFQPNKLTSTCFIIHLKLHKEKTTRYFFHFNLYLKIDIFVILY